MIVQAAKRNGIVTAPREPEDARAGRAARSGSAIALALLQVLVEDRVEVVLDRRRAGDVGLRRRRRMAERAQELVGVLLRVREVERRDDVAVEDMRPPGTSGSRLPGRHRPGGAVETRWSRALSAGSFESGTRKTTVNAPSLRSPKCSSSIVRTRSESVPGTVNVFDEQRARASPSAADRRRRGRRARPRPRPSGSGSSSRVQRSISLSGAKLVSLAESVRRDPEVPLSLRDQKRTRHRPAARARSRSSSPTSGRCRASSGLRRGFRPQSTASAPTTRRADGRRRARRASTRTSVQLVVAERTLVIAGERRGRTPHGRVVYQQMEIEYGPFQRQDHARRGRRPRAAPTASYEHGLLTIVLPLAPNARAAGRVTIEVEARDERAERFRHPSDRRPRRASRSRRPCRCCR